MRWEDLSGDRFVEAVKASEHVGLLPISVVEHHGPHLPLGTDMHNGREICRRAAELEPAIVFPDYIFGQINEARHMPGTISIDRDIMLRLLDNICAEMARNGLTKVVLVNCHGGNAGLLSFFNMVQLQSRRDYVVYVAQPISVLFSGQVQTPWDPSTEGHAGPGETSMMQVYRPDLVDMASVPAAEEGHSRNSLKELKDVGVQTGISWYSDYPTHYMGDASSASPQVGEKLLEAAAQDLARSIRAIKKDTVSQELLKRFYEDAEAPLAR